MGLDMDIYKRAKKGSKVDILNKLESDEDRLEDVAYWRKFYELQDSIGDILGLEIENCEEYVLSHKDMNRIIDWLDKQRDNEDIAEIYRGCIDGDIKTLNKAIRGMDWDNYEFFYRGWW